MLDKKYSEIMKNSINTINNNIEKFAINKPITLIGVSKFQSIEKMHIAYDLGIRHFGENRGQEVRDKKEFFLRKNDIQVSFIGRLQKNKVKYLINVCNMIQSIDSIELAEYINEKYKSIDKTIDILIEINVSKEESKAGFEIDQVNENIKKIKELKNLNIRGLMTLGPLTDNKEKIENAFKQMYEIYNDLKKQYDNFNYLSMGMTDDYTIALKNGSNMIRIGRLIFGERE